MTFDIIALIACVLLSGFFSASEMSYSSANRMRLENLRDDGNRSARLACTIVDKFDNALSAILIGNNFVNIAVSSLASVIALTAFGGYTAVATVVVTIVVIIFGETMPKIIAKKNANRLALVFAPFIRALMIVLTPIIFVVVGAVHLITGRMKGEENAADEEEAAVEELQSIIETAEDEDVIDEERSELLLSALDFSEIMASEVMTARVDVLAIEISDSYEENLKIIEESPYSRLPVFDGSIDNIVGILSVNRFFRAAADGEKVDIRSLLMEPCYVYKTMKLPAVLSKMRKTKLHLAIVTDEYGGSMGVITMEDVLEQIVGEIWDETDEVVPEVVERNDGYELDGDMNMADFLELLDRDEESFETESATVGGWTIESFGTFPEPGQSFDFENLRVTVLKMDGRRVERVLVRIEKEEE